MKPPISAVITTYFPYSHADVIVTKFLKGFPTDDHGLLEPRTHLVSAYLDQIDARDMGQAIFWRHGVRLDQSIRGALMADGKLVCRGIILIGEHGDYATDSLGRKLYPRRHLFEQILGVFEETGEVCPVFSDKHLSYNWPDAKWMYDRAKELGVPFMAGLSLPLGCRKPWLELDRGADVRDAVSIGYAGVESYGYHAIETLQCMVERRRGGETGVAAVEYLEGEDVWRAIDDGRIRGDLVDAALDCIDDKADGPFREQCTEPMAFLFEYNDGLRAATLMLSGYLKTFGFAADVAGDTRACEVHLQDGFPHAHSNYLSLNIEEMFVTGVPSYPVERTLLTTGMTNAVMDSRHTRQRVETPWLDVVYESYDTVPWRTQHPRPTGANLDVWPPRR